MLNQLIATEAIRQQKARYCRYVDSRQWEEFRSLLKDDLEVRIFDPSGTVAASFDRAQDFVDSAREFLSGTQSAHQIHGSELTVNSDSSVSAIWSMEDYVVKLQQGQRFEKFHGYGHYHEVWERDGDRWKIARLELRRIIVEIDQEPRQ